MNLSKKIKIIAILSIVIMVFIGCSQVLSYTWSDKVDSLDGEKLASTTIEDTTKDVLGSIISVTRTIAMGIAIIMITTVAMKYMMSAPGERAEIKKHAVIYIVGAVVLFASSEILKIIADFASGIKGG